MRPVWDHPGAHWGDWGWRRVRYATPSNFGDQPSVGGRLGHSMTLPPRGCRCAWSTEARHCQGRPTAV